MWRSLRRHESGEGFLRAVYLCGEGRLPDGDPDTVELRRVERGGKAVVAGSRFNLGEVENFLLGRVETPLVFNLVDLADEARGAVVAEVTFGAAARSGRIQQGQVGDLTLLRRSSLENENILLGR